MKREVPGREPRIFPLVRHRDDVVVDHVAPFAVRDLSAFRARLGSSAVLREPLVDIEEVVLLAPQHAGERLPHDVRGVVADGGRRHAR